MKILESDQIRKIIPHRPPFLFIDRVLEITPGKFGKAIKAIGSNEPYLQGHFPEQTIFPGVLMIEALAQTIAVVMGYTEEPGTGASPKVGYLAKVEMKFLQVVRPGDTLTLEVRLLSHVNNFVQMQCRALLSSGPAGEGRLTVAL